MSVTLALLLQISNPAPAQTGPVVDQAARDAAAAAQSTANSRATTAQVQAAQDAATAAAQAAASKASASDLTALAATVPTAATTMPPSVADAGARGTVTTRYALENHTHASKARKGRVLVPVAGFTDVTFSTPFSTGAPLCAVVAETAAGDTNVVNAQIDGPTTMTGMRIRITRTQVTVASLLGLSILSVPTQVATNAHYICIEP